MSPRERNNLSTARISEHPGSCEDHANEPTCICADKNPYWHRLMQKGMHEDFGVKNHMITMSPPPFVATTARRAAAGPQNLAQSPKTPPGTTFPRARLQQPRICGTQQPEPDSVALCNPWGTPKGGDAPELAASGRQRACQSSGRSLAPPGARQTAAAGLFAGGRSRQAKSRPRARSVEKGGDGTRESVFGPWGCCGAAPRPCRPRWASRSLGDPDMESGS